MLVTQNPFIDTAGLLSDFLYLTPVECSRVIFFVALNRFQIKR